MAKRILVADSDPLHRELVETMLTRAGHCVVGVSDGEACLRLFSDCVFDLAVLDLFLPDDTVLKAVNGRRLPFPVIGMAENCGVGLGPAVSMGARAVLRKPFTSMELLAEVETILAVA